MDNDRFQHYIVGVPELDDDHRELYTLLGKFRESIDAGDELTASKYKDEFFVKLDKHLETENRIMNECDYPHIKSHDWTHSALEMMFKHAPVDKTLKYSSFLVEDELLHHIDWHDSQIAEYYNKWKQLKETA